MSSGVDLHQGGIVTPTRPIRFIHRGAVQEVTDLAPTTTVLSWLREHARACGTKEGCNEGDCGACTVAVAERQADGQVSLRNLNSCLLFLPALDGKALFTVEDLPGLTAPRDSAADGLHPVQRALVDHHGSQCGFCTPGFVMSMWTTHENALRQGHTPSRQEWADALAGNLCRCTGYRPILDAAQNLQGPATLDWDALGRQLSQLAQDPALHYAASDEALGTGGTRAFHAPTSSDELAALLQQDPKRRLLGGATDIGLWVNKQHRDVGDLVATQSARDLRQVILDANRLRIGAAVNLEEAWSALGQEWPSLMDLWRRFASPPVRHAGTLAGNVANGSPIGDAPPILMALNAELVLRAGDQRRRVRLDEFYLGYQRNALQAGEFIEWIEVPRAGEGQVVKAWKVSKRYDSDISAVCAGFGLRFTPAARHEGRLNAVTMAFGGMAATVKRAKAAEEVLLSTGWSESGIEAACSALAQDFQPMSDLRASANFRLQAAQALVRRLWWSLQTDAPQVEVWR